jgi:hypothetical protein
VATGATDGVTRPGDKEPPPPPRGSKECPSCGEFIDWEGKPPTDCPICGEVLLLGLS